MIEGQFISPVDSKILVNTCNQSTTGVEYTRNTIIPVSVPFSFICCLVARYPVSNEVHFEGVTGVGATGEAETNPAKTAQRERM